MKKLLLAFTTALCCSMAAKASPGDTTWVQVFNGDSLTHYGNFDKAVSFPNGTTSYRKVYMIFTMGEYQCPAGTQYCHQWDYTVTNFVMTPTDTLEIGRFISPYATAGSPRFPNTWTQRYVYDVTDFYPVLKNNAVVRLNYSGYSWGFTANVKFAFVEGTPERNVLGIDRMWHGSFDYGNTNNPIDNHLQPISKTAPANTQAAEMHFTVTGHGADATSQCCEFNTNAYPTGHAYAVKLNNTQVAKRYVWRDNCGSNELYPQGGTWIFDRGGWCPGADVEITKHKLPGIAANSNYSLDVDFDSYTNSGTSFGSYSLEGQVFYYGNINRSVDASIEEIIAPTNNERFFRENPSSSKPVIKVRNSGSTPITSIKFEYGVKDSAMTQYVWNGNIPALTDTIIMLPEVNTITNMSLAGKSGVFNFVAKVLTVNGAIDNDQTNDVFYSTFVVAPTWPANFVVSMKTNNEGVNGIGAGASENSWVITDMSGTVVASRTNANISTQYNDTVKIGPAGFYKLQVMDGGCDGISWGLWAQLGVTNITKGSFAVNKTTIGSIPLAGNFNGDFGCGFTQYFTTVGNWPAGVNNITTVGNAAIEAFPNPAQNTVTVKLDGLNTVKGQIHVIDAIGRVVLEQSANSATQTLNVSRLSNGAYTIVYFDELNNNAKMQTRLMIVK